MKKLLIISILILHATGLLYPRDFLNYFAGNDQESWKIASVKVDGQYMTEFNGACIIGTEIILYPDGSYNSYVPCQDDHYPSYPGNYSYDIIGNDRIYFSNTDTCQFEILGPFRFQTRNLAEVFNGVDTTILEIQTVYEKQ